MKGKRIRYDNKMDIEQQEGNGCDYAERKNGKKE